MTIREKNPSDSDLRKQLAEVLEQLKVLAGIQRDAAEFQIASVFSIAEFCLRNRVSEAQYHKLRRQGRGPRTMTIGDRYGIRISRQAEADWIRERERETAEAAIPAEAAE